MPMTFSGPTAAQSYVGITAQVHAFKIKVFEEVLREEVGKGFDNQPIVFTDGWPNKDYRTGRPFGRIEARPRAMLGNVVEWFLEELERLSPVLTGRYQRSHVVMVDGHVVTDLSAITAGKRIVVANIQPYAGKIEGKDAFTRYELKGGKRSRRAVRKRQGWQKSATQGQSRQAPNGVYRVAIRNLQKRFGRTVIALYQPQPLPPSVAAAVSVKTKHGKSRAQVYPAVVLAVLN